MHAMAVDNQRSEGIEYRSVFIVLSFLISNVMIAVQFRDFKKKQMKKG
jgi:hypothetical protein